MLLGATRIPPRITREQVDDWIAEYDREFDRRVLVFKICRATAAVLNVIGVAVVFFTARSFRMVPGAAWVTLCILVDLTAVISITMALT